MGYGHYSLIARSQALRCYFVEGCGWEAAAPAVKDPDRVADPSTLRRWFRSLDSSPALFLFAPDDAGPQRLAAQGREPGTRFPAIALAHNLSVSRPVLALADLRNCGPPTILAWEDSCLPPTLDSGGESSAMVEDLERLKQRAVGLRTGPKHPVRATSDAKS